MRLNLLMLKYRVHFELYHLQSVLFKIVKFKKNPSPSKHLCTYTRQFISFSNANYQMYVLFIQYVWVLCSHLCYNHVILHLMKHLIKRLWLIFKTPFVPYACKVIMK